jgi:hypothetical protein
MKERTVMTIEDRAAFVKAIVEGMLLPVMSKKGRDYTEYVQTSQKRSANSNFTAIAEMFGDAGVDKYKVWAIYFLKHVQSILSWVATKRVESEKIEGRMTDAINYLFILWSMLVEDGVVPNPLEKTDKKRPSKTE